MSDPSHPLDLDARDPRHRRRDLVVRVPCSARTTSPRRSPSTAPSTPSLDPGHPTIQHLLDVAHLCVGVSYYKLTMPGRVRSPRPLHPAIEALVPQLYDQGCESSRCATGCRTAADRVRVPRGEIADPPGSARATDRRGPLVPFGGGKDSTLTFTLLDDPTLLSVHPTEVQRRVAVPQGSTSSRWSGGSTRSSPSAPPKAG